MFCYLQCVPEVSKSLDINIIQHQKIYKFCDYVTIIRLLCENCWALIICPAF